MRSVAKQVGKAGGSPTQCQIIVEEAHFLDATILCTMYMTQPLPSALSEQRCILGQIAQETSSVLDIIVWSCQDMPRIRRMLLM